MIVVSVIFEFWEAAAQWYQSIDSSRRLSGLDPRGTEFESSLLVTNGRWQTPTQSDDGWWSEFMFLVLA